MKKILLLTSLFMLALSSLCFAAEPYAGQNKVLFYSNDDEVAYVVTDTIKFTSDTTCDYVVVTNESNIKNNVAHVEEFFTLADNKLTCSKANCYDTDWNLLYTVTVDSFTPTNLSADEFAQTLKVFRKLKG